MKKLIKATINATEMKRLAITAKIVFLSCAMVWCGNGCNLDTYEFGDKAGWHIPDASEVDAGPIVDAGPDACVPTEEVCDGEDNNCDGIIDDGFDLENDPENCGECNNVCEFDNAFAHCEEGECVMGACMPGYWDLNEDDSDGCEYGCLPTNGGVETCDGRDNNCDGETDEGFDLDNDPMHCGECNNVCVFFKGEGACVGGECVLDYCYSGYVNKDGDDTNGCECMINAPEDPDGAVCESTEENPCGEGNICVDRDLDGEFHCSPIPPDVCNGVDTNCNGETDEDAPVGEPCYTNPTGCSYDEGTDTWTCEGECTTGTIQCSGGMMQCLGQKGPSMEMCNGLDDNCDGETDEDFDLVNDPMNCGGCGNTCTQVNVPNAIAGCENGGCVVVACMPGFHNLDGEHSTGCEYECTYTNGGVEVCGDVIDNDCNGETDEGFDFENDPQHCGGCNNECNLANAVSDCQAGNCVLVDCLDGYWDVNNDPSDGCEYGCATTNGGVEICDGLEGVEICDGLDNDCNSVTDDGFDTSSDMNNCGSCGHSCADYVPDGAQVSACDNGGCVYLCREGYHDLNGDLVLGQSGDGCEYACSLSNSGVEICDNKDNNCNGNMDADGNGYPLTQSCYTGPDGTEGVGICKGGTAVCTGGGWGDCAGEVTPEAHEQCDDLDHNCDGDPMDGFDLTSDVLNCGGCGNSCFDSMPDNSYATGCSASTCEYDCQGGFHNLDSDWSNGCEYECWQTTAPGVEYCDGVDNNCDGDTDTLAYLVDPPEGYCRTDPGTPCEGTPAVCADGILGVTWYCDYTADVETDPINPNRVLFVENLCDGIDGNCDGNIDEAFHPIVGTECDDGLLGVCRGTGNYQCNAQQDGTECVITSSGQVPEQEMCDGEDNDCDGLTDETYLNPGSNPTYVEDDLVSINVGGETVFVYRFEASRPTATNSSTGVGSSVRACSKPDVLPWANVTYEQARQACMKAGMTLCADEEWSEACDGEGTTWVYPYHESDFSATACNSSDANIGGSVPTGSMPDCATQGYSIEDLSGNLREWTSTIVGYTTTGKAIYSLRGGSYTDTAEGVRCDFTSTGFVEDSFAGNVGFRCCSRCGNGVLDPGEECDWDIDPDCTKACGPPTCGDGVVDPREDCDCGTDTNNLPTGCIDINGAPASNCAINCTRPEERCSTLYPEDQDGGGEVDDCDDPACDGIYWCLDHSDNDGDGWTVAMGDCQDNDPDVYPGAPIICNDGKDNNCNGFIDNNEPDKDGDGYPPCLNFADYDCDDNDSDVNPGSIEIPGDGKDNNCNGLTDEPREACDCDITNPSLVEAMELCEPVFLQNVQTYGDARAWDVFESFGALSPRTSLTHSAEGLLEDNCNAVMLCTGRALSTNPQTGTSFGRTDPHPLGGGVTARDLAQIIVSLRIPENAEGLSFDFMFLSSEYPEWVCTAYNDTFFAILEDPGLNNGNPINISFDGNDNEITVNNNFFENPNNWTESLAGTGYDTADPWASCSGSSGGGCTLPNPCPPPNNTVGSGTGWLRTIAPLTPGADSTITFSIHDEGDNIYDSCVILDNFQWVTSPVDGPVTIK